MDLTSCQATVSDTERRGGSPSHAGPSSRRRRPSSRVGESLELTQLRLITQGEKLSNAESFFKTPNADSARWADVSITVAVVRRSSGSAYTALATRDVHRDGQHGRFASASCGRDAARVSLQPLDPPPTRKALAPAGQADRSRELPTGWRSQSARGRRRSLVARVRVWSSPLVMGRWGGAR
jgi:hypothetical protein